MNRKTPKAVTPSVRGPAPKARPPAPLKIAYSRGPGFEEAPVVAPFAASSSQTERQVQDWQTSSAEASYEEQLVALLERYNPGKLANVPYLLVEWAGREDQLLSNVRQAYGISRDPADYDDVPHTPANRMTVSSSVALRSPGTGAVVGSRTKSATAPTPGMALPVVDAKEQRIDQIKELAIKQAAQIKEYHFQVKQRQEVQVKLGQTTKKFEQARTAMVEGRRQQAEIKNHYEEEIALEREKRIKHAADMAVHRFGKRELTRGWLTWLDIHMEHKRRYRLLHAAGARIVRPKVVHALQHWKDDYNAAQ